MIAHFLKEKLTATQHGLLSPTPVFEGTDTLHLGFQSRGKHQFHRFSRAEMAIAKTVQSELVQIVRTEAAALRFSLFHNSL